MGMNGGGGVGGILVNALESGSGPLLVIQVACYLYINRSFYKKKSIYVEGLVKMEVKQVAALPERLAVTDMEMIEDVLTITAVAICLHPCCPLCGKPSTRTHSHYIRQVADLPCGGQQVRLLIQVRKCFCDAPDYARKIFVERLTPFVDTFARVTQRLYQIVQIIGLATGGILGVRVTDRLEIQTSRHTILRRIMALPAEPVGKVSQIGIDDFSFRRGCKFGTIIVDLRTHQVLDVLPDRTADTSAAWMGCHPEIEVVSRDRGGDYAAARKADPGATQTADRFHLLVRRIGACFDTFQRKEGLRATDP